MPEILAFISPDADRAMREHLMLLFYMRGIAVTDDMKRATIVVMPKDKQNMNAPLHEEMHQTEHTIQRLKGTEPNMDASSSHKVTEKEYLLRLLEYAEQNLDVTSLRKEIEEKQYIYRRLEHAPEIFDMVIPTQQRKNKHKKSFAHSTTLKKYNCAKTNYAQRFFNRTTCK